MVEESNDGVTRALGGALARLGARIRGPLHEAVAAHGMNPLHAAILRDLDQPTPMGAIAEKMCVDASYVTALVDRLEELGYVERRTDPADRRVRHVAITRNGEEARKEIAAAFAAATDLFSDLEPEERADLLRLLHKVLARAAEPNRRAAAGE